MVVEEAAPVLLWSQDLWRRKHDEVADVSTDASCTGHPTAGLSVNPLEPDLVARPPACAVQPLHGKAGWRKWPRAVRYAGLPGRAMTRLQHAWKIRGPDQEGAVR